MQPAGKEEKRAWIMMQEFYQPGQEVPHSTSAPLPLARAQSHCHTSLQGDQGNAVKLCARGEEEMGLMSICQLPPQIRSKKFLK